MPTDDEAYGQTVTRRRSRSVAPWLCAAAALVAAIGGAAVVLHRAGSNAESLLAVRKELAGSVQQIEDARIDAALLALKMKDSVGTLTCLEAVSGPRAAGLRIAATAQGVPQKRWSVRTEAGCAQLAMTVDRVFCATLGGVEVHAIDGGATLPRLSAGPVGWQRALLVDPEGVVVGGDDRRLHLFAGADFRPTRSLGPFEDTIVSVARVGTQLQVGLANGSVVTETGQVVGQVRGPARLTVAHGVTVLGAVDETTLTLPGASAWHVAGRAQAVSVSADGEVALAVGRQLLLWRREKPIQVLPSVGGKVVALSMEGLLVTGDEDGVVTWRTPEGSVEGRLSTGASINALVVLHSSQETLFVTAHVDRRLELWRLPDADRSVPPDEPVAATFDVEGLLLQPLADGRLWSRGTSLVRLPAPGKAIAASPTALRADAARALLGDDDGALTLVRWNGEIGGAGRLSKSVTAAALSADGRFAASCRAGGLRVGRVDAPTRFSDSMSAVVRALAFAPDGRLAIGREDKMVELRSSDGAVMATLEPFDAPVSALAWGPTELMVGTSDGQVQAWSLSPAVSLNRWVLSRQRAGVLSFSPKGLLAVGADDGNVTLLDPSTGRVHAIVPLLSGPVLAFRWADTRLLVATADGRLHSLQIE